MKKFFTKNKKIILIISILFLSGLLFNLFFYNQNYECFNEEFLVCPNTEHRVVDTGYFKDGNKIYYQVDLLAKLKKVKGVDLRTFKIYHFDNNEDKPYISDYAKDKNNCYENGRDIEMNRCNEVENQK